MKHQNFFEPSVYIIDDDPDLLNVLKLLFESIDLPIKCFENPLDFFKDYHPNLQGCIVTDVRMPLMGGIQMLEKLKIMKNKLPVILLTGNGDIPMVIHAMKLGAIDFITKPFNNQNLLDVVQKCMITNTLEEDADEIFKRHLKTLTKREHEVMKLVISGKLNKQIAMELHLSLSTIEFHRAKFMQKMKAKNIIDLMNMIRRNPMSSETLFDEGLALS